MEQTEEKVIKKHNLKLYPIYKMFSWDLLFYYSTIFLFLTQVKGLTASTILFGDSFYYIFKIIAQIPCVNIVELMGKRKALLLGNSFITLCLLCLILGNGLTSLLLCNLFMAIAFSIKSICEPAILNESATISESSRDTFSKIDSKGSSLYYYFDAISAMFCGFLFVFNNHLPIYISLGFSIISIILSSRFISLKTTNTKYTLKENGNFKVYLKDLKIAFKNIFHSNRLKALLLFSGLFYSIITVRSTISNNLLVKIGVQEEYFGIISAFLTIVAGISSKNQNFFHKKFRNKVLSYFSLTFSISMIIAGLSSIIIKNSIILFTIVIGIYAIFNIIRAPYYTLQKRYLNSFSSPSMSSKIYSACTLIESTFNAITYWIASFMLNHIDASSVMVIIGCIFTIAFIFVLDYMKERIGLKPEQYKKSDIHFTEVH